MAHGRPLQGSKPAPLPMLRFSALLLFSGLGRLRKSNGNAKRSQEEHGAMSEAVSASNEESPTPNLVPHPGASLTIEMIDSHVQFLIEQQHKFATVMQKIQRGRLTRARLKAAGDGAQTIHEAHCDQGHDDARRGRMRFRALSTQQKQSQAAAVARAERQELDDRKLLEEQLRDQAAVTLQKVARGKASRANRRVAPAQPRSPTARLPPPIRSRFRTLSESTPGVRAAAPASALATASLAIPALRAVCDNLLPPSSTGCETAPITVAGVEISSDEELSSLRSIASIARSIAQSFGPNSAELVSMRSERPAPIPFVAAVPPPPLRPRPLSLVPTQLLPVATTPPAHSSDRSGSGPPSYRPPSARPPSFRSKLRALSEQSPVSHEAEQKPSSRSQTSSQSAASSRAYQQPFSDRRHHKARSMAREQVAKTFLELGLVSSPLAKRPPGVVSYRAKASLLPPAAMGSPPIRPGNFAKQRSTSISDLKFVESLLANKSAEANDISHLASLGAGDEQRVWVMPLQHAEPVNNAARAVGTWVNAPKPPSETDALIGRLSRVRAEGLKNVLTKAFLETYGSTAAHRLSIIEALIESGAISKTQGLRLIGDFVPPTFEKTVVAAAFSYSEPAKADHGPRRASLELHSDGAAFMMVTEADPLLGVPYTWSYHFPNAADDSDEITLRLRGWCASEMATDESCFELSLMEGGGWRGLVGGASLNAEQWEVVFWSNPYTSPPFARAG